MSSSSRNPVLEACFEIMAQVEVEIIMWNLQLREWKEKLNAPVGA